MNGALWLLPLFAVGYALWAFFRLRRMERNEPADGIVAEDTPCRQEIIGRSRFVLDPRHSRPQAAVESETEKVTEKADIFVPTNVPEHPRQIPPEDLTNLWKSTFRCTMNLSRMRTRRSRIMTRMKTTPKSCPFWAARLPRGLVLNRWAKPTATWYTIHLQQTSKGRKRDVSSWA